MPTTFGSCAAESDRAAVFSFAAVYRGYRQCRQHKRGTANAQRYEHRLLDHLVDTAQALQDRTYAPSRSLCFVARQPKAREIHAADFRDRVVHHVLVPRLEALFEPVFIHDLYSNRVGKGTHAAVARLASFMLYIPGIAELHSASTASAAPAPSSTRRSQDSAAPPGKGLPIGNLTSQFRANVYLNELDQFVKHRLKCRYYLRYVDDLILLNQDPERLRDWEQAIAGFLAERLQLALKPDWTLRPVTDGADFLGYIVRPDYRLVRRRVVGNLRVKLASFARVHVTATGLRLPPVERDRLRAWLASYLGHFAHADAWRLAHSLFVRYPWLGIIFRLRERRLVPCWEPLAATSLHGQVVWFRRALRPAMPLVQIGNRVALFEPHLSPVLARAPWLGRWRSARPETRPGLTPGLSWPLSAIKGLGRSLRQVGLAYAFIAEEGYLPGGLKRRVLRYLFTGHTTDTMHSRG